MSKLTVKIAIQIVWLKEPTDLSKCNGCNEIIYGKMFRLWIMPKVGRLHLFGHTTGMVLCESCCTLTDKD